MKVQLFIPKAPIGYNPNCGIYFPISLLQIASYVKSEKPEVEITIWDGELYEDNSLLFEKLDSDTDVVGISCTSFNHQYVLELAKRANQIGALVVLGGLHATYYADVILQNRSDVDVVIAGKGEKAFKDLLDEFEKNGCKDFPRRVIRENNGLLVDDLPDLDYSLLALDQYWQRHAQIYPGFANKSISVITHEGCGKRHVHGPCSFCSITQAYHARDPELFWESLSSAVEKYGFDFIKDWGDSLTSVPGLLPRLVATRPAKLDHLEFAIFDNLADLDNEAMELLKQLNVRVLFAGVESANNEILKRMNKQITIEEMEKALRLVGHNGIPLFLSFVLGERGETRQTLEQSVSFARQVSQFAELKISNGSPMAILPGAPNFERLAKQNPWLRNQDLLDLNELKRMWVRAFCPDLPNYEILEEYASLIGEFGELDFRFGWD